MKRLEVFCFTAFLLLLSCGCYGAGASCVGDECVEDGVEEAWHSFLARAETKAAMLQHLRTEVYARLVPSAIEGAGVGVQAIRSIRKGTFPFSTFHPRPAYMSRGGSYDHTVERSQEDVDRRLCHYDFEFVLLPQQELTTRDLALPGVAKLASDFFGTTRVDGVPMMPVPLLGPNSFDLSWYVNHATSDEANLEVRELPQCRHEVLVARRDIEEGEELTFDYSTLDMSLYFQ